MADTLDHILASTDAKPTGPDKWMGHGPCHGSRRNRDFSIRVTPERILVYCFARCDLDAICQALGIEKKELFRDAPIPHGHQPAPKSARMDCVALAFRFDMAALDLRVRAERIVEIGKKLNIEDLNDDELDRALEHVAQAHADRERAELIENVSDALRFRDWTERKSHERYPRVA